MDDSGDEERYFAAMCINIAVKMVIPAHIKGNSGPLSKSRQKGMGSEQGYARDRGRSRAWGLSHPEVTCLYIRFRRAPFSRRLHRYGEMVP